MARLSQPFSVRSGTKTSIGQPEYLSFTLAWLDGSESFERAKHEQFASSEFAELVVNSLNEADSKPPTDLPPQPIAPSPPTPCTPTPGPPLEL